MHQSFLMSFSYKHADRRTSRQPNKHLLHEMLAGEEGRRSFLGDIVLGDVGLDVENGGAEQDVHAGNVHGASLSCQRKRSNLQHFSGDF